MRSIRRSMTVYLLVLLAITFGVVWVVIDQVTARALAAREAAGSEVIKKVYEERVREEREKTDQALLHQARELGNILQTHYAAASQAETAKFRLQVTTAHWMFTPNPLALAGWSSAFNQPPFAPPHPLSALLF